ncbi:UNVERIFIED_CONTAM: hypothetical protein GTU68_060343 [Idotea baltica]|nr:hypothetical protein [Idotea baltica]
MENGCIGCRGDKDKIGVLVAQLGTPDAPTKKALYPYLKQFLGDPRIIEKPRLLWWLILNCIILPLRPKKSAALYARIWTDEGSPLRIYTEKQTELLEQRLKKVSSSIEVVHGMRYGGPSLPDAIDDLISRGCSKILLFNIHCTETSAALIPKLNFPKDKIIHTYQSRFGKDPWLVPYTDETIDALAQEGVKKIVVACPGFTADCLETLDEMGNEAEESFVENGGEKLELLACLNEQLPWIDAMEEIVCEELGSWLKTAKRVESSESCAVLCPVKENKKALS